MTESLVKEILLTTIHGIHGYISNYERYMQIINWQMIWFGIVLIESFYDSTPTE